MDNQIQEMLRHPLKILLIGFLTCFFTFCRDAEPKTINTIQYSDTLFLPSVLDVGPFTFDSLIINPKEDINKLLKQIRSHYRSVTPLSLKFDLMYRAYTKLLLNRPMGTSLKGNIAQRAKMYLELRNLSQDLEEKIEKVRTGPNADAEMMKLGEEMQKIKKRAREYEDIEKRILPPPLILRRDSAETEY